MRFFNIDQHISVIADLRRIFTRLGHHVTDWCLSGHAYVMGRRQDDVPMLKDENWCGFVERQDWNRFYTEYHETLEAHDAFICCYPPVFSYLYKTMTRPILVNIPIRYDYSMEQHADKVLAFNEYLRQPHIILTANNLFDKHYCEAMCPGVKVQHIPSLCEYTGMRYAPKRSEFLYYGPRAAMQLMPAGVVRKEDALPAGYGWQDVARFRGIIHLPYQVSTMSIFEQYTASIPLFVPSRRFMLELYTRDLVLEHYSPFKLARRAPGSVVPVNSLYDPNRYDDIDAVAHWLQYADYYDAMWMPHIQQFDSFDHLRELLATVDLEGISHEMYKWNITRRAMVYRSWTGTLRRIERMIADA